MSAIANYLTAVKKELAQGDATEHTHRPALKTLLEAMGGKGVTATNEPKRIKCGAPDFRVTRRTVPVGHVETKDIGINLDEMVQARGPQAKQFLNYRDGLSSWILTDYLDFRWFVNGELRMVARLGSLDSKGKIKALPNGEEEVGGLLCAFLAGKTATVRSAKELAQRMAGMTRIVRDVIERSLEDEPPKGWLHRWLLGFQQVLIPDLNEARFSDMFAQTIAYGLFAARVHAPPDRTFTREMAAGDLPKTNPFLRKLFSEIAGVEMPETIAWAVDDLVELLAHADMSRIMKDFGKGQGKEDPVVHFYETFLAAYDPRMRELRGVYYTPEPVVSYIVRSVDLLLKNRFGRPKGLADAQTLILDPAVGTATFLYSVLGRIHASFAKQRGAWNSYVADHLLNRIFGFELLMAPYAVAHLKLGMQLQQTGYTFKSDERLGIYLTNTLEQAAKKSEEIFGTWVSEEANAAAEIKARKPIMVVLGNPPYSVSSQNRGEWIQGLIEDYKQNLHEKKLNLDDDFIKFIRFGQWRVESTGHGILAFITNNTYLDGITHRRMRECLRNAFTSIYVLNLHGSTMKRERTPGGGADENVFDIMQGVAIALFVKEEKVADCRIFHADLWGERSEKYARLEQDDVATTEWTEVRPTAPHFFFVPKALSHADEYGNFPGIAGDIFIAQNAGIQTKRDHFVYHFTREELEATLRDIRRLGPDDLRAKYDLPPDGRDWTVADARSDVQKGGGTVARVLYRPFDWRWALYTGRTKGLMAYPRAPLMKSALHPNRLLLFVRNARRGNVNSFFVADAPVDKDAVSPFDNVTFAPLYAYSDHDGTKPQLGLEGERQLNLASSFIKDVEKRLKLKWTGEAHGAPGRTVGAEDMFAYIYALFFSPSYRTRYGELLNLDYPRVPVTADRKLFASLVVKGEELIALHLMRAPNLDKLITEFPKNGENEVERVVYSEGDLRVWINDTQFFAGVPADVWAFSVGGHQVCHKWLKDRRGRKLTYDDLVHYQRIVVALSGTVRAMKELDALIPAWPLA